MLIQKQNVYLSIKWFLIFGKLSFPWPQVCHHVLKDKEPGLTDGLNIIAHGRVSETGNHPTIFIQVLLLTSQQLQWSWQIDIMPVHIMWDKKQPIC